MPSENRSEISDEPPIERKGKGIPVTGTIPKFMPILIKNWNQIIKKMPKLNKNRGLLSIVKALFNRDEDSK